MVAMCRRGLAVGLWVAVAPVAAPGGEPPFLVGVPVGSLPGELSSMNRVATFCRASAAERAEKPKKCLEKAEDQARFARAAGVLCAGRDVVPGHPVELSFVARTLALCEPTEALLPTEEPSPGVGLPGPAGLESILVAGLADFVVDRARAEAIEFALDQVAEVLCAKEKARKLFPSLCALATAAEQVRTSLVPGRMLRDAIVADLRALARNLAAAAEEDAPARNELVCALRLADAVVAGLERREPPLSLALVAAEGLASVCPCPVALGWRTECKAPPTDPSPADGLSLASTFAVARAAQRGAGVSLDPSAALADVEASIGLAPVAAKVKQRAREVAGKLVGPALRLRRALDGYESSSADQRPAAARELLAASVDFLGAAVDAGLAMREQGPDTERARKQVAVVAAMARHLLAGDYSAGITDLVGSGLFDASREPYSSLLRMSSLVVEVSAARTSAEVAKALETAASPASSWRLRRKKTVWGVSARLGLAAAKERVQGSPSAPDGTVLGFHAPVGIDASRPLGHTWALGAMLQVLDLGTVVGARVAGRPGDAGAKDRPEVGFPQVFAPGAALFLGLGKTPFVLSGGAAWSPSLRPVTTGEARNVWRIGASLSVDVPIFMW